VMGVTTTPFTQARPFCLCHFHEKTSGRITCHSWQDPKLSEREAKAILRRLK
jgi:hypothetical protein